MTRRDEVLVLVADASRAELLRRLRSGPPFETIAVFDNPDAHLPDRALGEDRPGRTHESVGPRRSAIAPRTAPRTRVLVRFAAALAAEVEGRVAAVPGTRVVLAAPPRLLRMIEARLNVVAASAVTRTVPKDLTKLPKLTLQARLADTLSAPG
ncbi:host attachment protein [Elioraea sp.]|uniref:host attachment protein n=1 Tax=Elioraea sp. TaxID=2185103 RepID=UPI0025C1A785|nr:host attachment protein [Elioraea sp.]